MDIHPILGFPKGSSLVPYMDVQMPWLQDAIERPLPNGTKFSSISQGISAIARLLALLLRVPMLANLRSCFFPWLSQQRELIGAAF